MRPSPWREATALKPQLWHAPRTGAFCAPLYTWAHAAGFPGMGGRDDFLDVSRCGLDEEAVLYLDVCHYTRPFAERIAAGIAAGLGQVKGET